MYDNAQTGFVESIKFTMRLGDVRTEWRFESVRQI